VTYDRPITIQRQNADGEWLDWAEMHAAVNKSQGSEYTDAGATRSVQTLVFRVRYDSRLRDIALNTQVYRILYDGAKYNVEDTDDYMMRHREFKMQGASYD
jgi:SPP1 family predicted phage head-tail adaptor